MPNEAIRLAGRPSCGSPSTAYQRQASIPHGGTDDDTGPSRKLYHIA